MIPVKGFCPACGKDQLGLDDIDTNPVPALACYAEGCPRPSTAAEILMDEEIHHRVKLNDSSFNILHPLRERLDGALLECRVADGIGQWSGPQYPVGEYRVMDFGEEQETWESLA